MSTGGAQPTTAEQGVLDLRTYRLVPDGRDEFDRLLREGALPMLRRAGIQVVGYGPSLVDEHHYFLARSFSSRAQREQQLGVFYGSDEWRENFDAPVMGLIESHHVVVVPLTARTEQTLTAALLSEPPRAHPPSN
ncbi:MAG TPA: NIPSNAP family protein [Gaiellaceae bacterium]|nr:NIPSNAP family protein [Gaiellaceae bacterium]